MRNRDRWDVVYADCFKNQPEGHALYKKLSITQLKPGTCGYFDDQGDWQQIEDLTVVNQQQTTKGTNAAEQRTESFTSVLGIRRIDDPEGEKWFLRKSENVHRLSAEALTKVSAPGLPMGGSITAGYSVSIGKGAVLVTSGFVKHTQTPPDSIVKMYKWMRLNGNLALEQYPDAKKKGLWMVTKTYSVKSRALALLLQKESIVTLGIKALEDQVGKVEASAEWMAGQQEGTWNWHNDDNGVVLSMDGIYWEDCWYSSKVKPVTRPRKQKFLGGEIADVVLRPISFTMRNDRTSGVSTVELMPEIRGIVKGVRLSNPDDLDDEDDDGGGECEEGDTDDEI